MYYWHRGKEQRLPDKIIAWKSEGPKEPANAWADTPVRRCATSCIGEGFGLATSRQGRRDEPPEHTRERARAQRAMRRDETRTENKAAGSQELGRAEGQIG